VVTSNPSQGADLTGSGRGVVGAILILIKLNGHIFVPSRDDPRNGQQYPLIPQFTCIKQNQTLINPIIVC
jgi:hypothetical protein